MGWYYLYDWKKRADAVADRTKGWEKDGATFACVKHCYRGCPWQGVLWTVWQRKVNGVVVDSWIGCDLLTYDKKDRCWGYKPMEEGMHPYYYNCPLSYLELVPVASEAWRIGVMAWHADRASRKAEKHAIQDS
jgi:hypothetical protein